MSNRYIYLFFSIMCLLSLTLYRCVNLLSIHHSLWALFLVHSSTSSTKTSVNYAQKDDGFLANVQMLVIIFFLLLGFLFRAIFYSSNKWFRWPSCDFLCTFFTPISEHWLSHKTMFLLARSRNTYTRHTQRLYWCACVCVCERSEKHAG